MKPISKISAFLTTVALLVIILFSAQVQGQNQAVKSNAVQVNSQRDQKDRFAMIPGLTEDQKTKIKDLMYDSSQDKQMLKAQLAEKKAHLRVLTLVDSPDRKSIDKTIDEMSDLRGNMMKHAIDTKFKIKGMLTPEQYKVWQMHQQHKGRMKAQGNRQGKSQGMRDDSENRMQQGRSQNNNRTPKPQVNTESK